VATIGLGAFTDCYNLSSVYNLCEVPQSIRDFVFSGVENIDLYVPELSIPDYQNADVWKNFKNILPVETYMVTYDTDNGEASVIKHVLPNTTDAPIATPSKTGYDFTGWYNGNELYDFDTPVTEDITLTAHWDIITYEITYELNGGTNHPDNPDSYTIESPTITLQDPTRAGYTFAGWVEGNNVIETGSTGNLTFTAQWSVGIKVISQSQTLTAWSQDGMLYVSGLATGEQWSVYTLGGVLVYEGKEASVALPSGIYVVKAGKRAVKVKN
jgi:uncharacterized repeat protein (TIGR02543 family)